MSKVPKRGLRVAAAPDGKRAIEEGVELPIMLGEVAELLREGLLALSVTAGLAVVRELVEEDLVRLCGPRGAHRSGRAAYRHGVEASSLPLGGRRVRVERPRARTIGGQEAALPSWQALAASDQLGELAVSRMLAGVSTRRYAAGGLEPVGAGVTERASGTSRSAVSRRFCALTEQRLAALLARPVPAGIRVLFIDGVSFGEQTMVGAIGVDLDGHKHLLGIAEGATENTSVVTALVAGLVERGLSADHGLLVVIDGAKALRRAIRDCFGDRAVVQRCQVHKLRNVTEKLPERERAFAKRKLLEAWRDPDPDRAVRSLKAFAATLDKTHPGAASSLREGLEETVAITRLGLVCSDALWRTLRSTNPIEQGFSGCRSGHRNVKRWRDGRQAMRWCAAGLEQTAKGWRRVRGYRSMTLLDAALRRHVQLLDPTQEAAVTVAA